MAELFFNEEAEKMCFFEDARERTDADCWPVKVVDTKERILSDVDTTAWFVWLVSFIVVFMGPLGWTVCLRLYFKNVQ